MIEVGMRFIFGICVTSFVLAVGHWFPWPRKLKRLEAYSYGVASILAGQAVWLLTQGQGMLFFLLLLFALAGGAVTGLAYLLDWILNQRARAQVGSDH